MDIVALSDGAFEQNEFVFKIVLVVCNFRGSQLLFVKVVSIVLWAVLRVSRMFLSILHPARIDFVVKTVVNVFFSFHLSSIAGIREPPK